ncbi:MAG: hypothetical protein K9N47_26385 [Prosthecobacter sp.]|uniref:hypothetical protein n=1 Tax=Prosthecobacter sp. TaxID=1965333 RepID=UPI00262A0762|nr:hypothetical protein [Prosthecobacter sp.]MCF7789680.1 hypothetical protein [Prosthecobacter sp.]
MKDTAPEINEMIFTAMMRKTPEERLLMGLDMMATARELAWSNLPNATTETERRRAFFLRFQGQELPL